MRIILTCCSPKEVYERSASKRRHIPDPESTVLLVLGIPHRFLVLSRIFYEEENFLRAHIKESCHNVHSLAISSLNFQKQSCNATKHNSSRSCTLKGIAN